MNQSAGRIQFKLMSLIMVLLLIFLQYKLWYGTTGVKNIIVLKKQLAGQTQINDALKKQNESLLRQIHYLRGSQDAIESRARQELGMIKKDETFYQVMK